MVMDLITVEEARPANPFAGKQHPKSLDEYFSIGRLSDVLRRNLIGANLASLHIEANARMKLDGVKLDQDNYFPHEASLINVCRPPFDALNIMSAQDPSYCSLLNKAHASI